MCCYVNRCVALTFNYQNEANESLVLIGQNPGQVLRNTLARQRVGFDPPSIHLLVKGVNWLCRSCLALAGRRQISRSSLKGELVFGEH